MMQNFRDLEELEIELLRIEGPPKHPGATLDLESPSNQQYIARSVDLKRVGHRLEILLHDASAFVKKRAEELLSQLKDVRKRHEQQLRVAIREFERKENLRRINRSVVDMPTSSSESQRLAPLHHAMIFLALVLSTLIGLSLPFSSLVLCLVKIIIKLAFYTARSTTSSSFNHQEPLPEYLNDILHHLPIDARTAIRRYNLKPPIILFATCPECNACYPPTEGTSKSRYQETCSWINVDGRTCGPRLTRARLVGNRKVWRAIRRYPFRHPFNCITSLMSRPDIEVLIEGNIADMEQVSLDLWDSEFFSNFLGPDNLPFFNGATRLAFALAIDWFNPYRNMEAKKKWSIGAIYLICLNLPPHHRFRTENVFLVGVIPGPREPSLEQVNHFIAPIISAFQTLWDPGLWVPATSLHPDGRLVRAIIALLIADLLGARHMAGFTFPGHRLFCSYCMLPRDRMDDFDIQLWPTHSTQQTRKFSQRWLAASSREDRDRLTETYGIRWSALNDLPYWDPLRQVIIDNLHMFLALLSKHTRGVWHMNMSVDGGEVAGDPFYSPPDIMTMAKAEFAMETAPKTSISKLPKKVIIELCLRRGIRTGGKTATQLRQDLHDWRISRGILSASGRVAPSRMRLPFQPPPLSEVCRSLKFEYSNVKITEAERRIFSSMSGFGEQRNLGEIVDRESAPTLRTLCLQRKIDPSGTRMEMVQRLLDPAMNRITLTSRSQRKDVEDILAEISEAQEEDEEKTILPDWIKAPPKKAGDVKHGKLSSQEWKSLFTVSFMITLVQTWGCEYRRHPSTAEQEVLDNYLHLALATMLSTQLHMTEEVIELYESHMHTYLKGFRILYPTHSIIPYHHLALHTPDFLRNFGPSGNWSTGPSETYNGMAQRISTNSRLGDLELTIMTKFSMASEIKSLESRGELPLELHSLAAELQEFISSSEAGGLARNVFTPHSSDLQTWSVASYTTPPSAHLRQKIREYLIQLGVQPRGSLLAINCLSRGNLNFSTGRRSSRDSQISYLIPKPTSGQEIYVGRIKSIIGEGRTSYEDGQMSLSRIFVIVERYESLSPEDRPNDPYDNHPMLGREGYNLCCLFYDSFSPKLDVIEAHNIIGHVSRCVLDPTVFGISQPIIVAVQLDGCYLAQLANKALVSKLRAWSRPPDPSHFPHPNRNLAPELSAINIHGKRSRPADAGAYTSLMIYDTD
ncbi:hypothetical protein FRC04_005977 [Tulasnella sp. 424]|nr:hypothetical protein FRC04_005977 [Tulasnella sp. 424]